jgi:predicted nucleic acid-binding protein
VILLDTNVLSALMRPTRAPGVVGWLDNQPAESVWTTTLTVFEVRYGLELLEPGERRQRLEAAFDALLRDDLEGRIQPFDEIAAAAAAGLAATQRRAGRALDVRAVLIAGIAVARRATLATRNTRHFDGLGVSLVNPWAVCRRYGSLRHHRHGRQDRLHDRLWYEREPDGEWRHQRLMP